MSNSYGSGSSKAKLSMRLALMMFALIPLVVVALSIGIVSITKSKKEIKSYTHDSFVQCICAVGNSFDTVVKKNEEILKSFAQAPVLRDALLNPNDSAKVAAAQQYTLDYFGSISGWEGLYIADWNSQVMTHPNEGAIGMVLREGDKLTGLQNSITGAASGVFNTGIMASPASGHNIMSAYTPIMMQAAPCCIIRTNPRSVIR